MVAGNNSLLCGQSLKVDMQLKFIPCFYIGVVFTSLVIEWRGIAKVLCVYLLDSMLARSDHSSVYK